MRWSLQDVTPLPRRPEASLWSKQRHLNLRILFLDGTDAPLEARKEPRRLIISRISWISMQATRSSAGNETPPARPKCWMFGDAFNWMEVNFYLGRDE